MKNAILFQVNSLFAYLIIYAPVSNKLVFAFAVFLLRFQRKVNDVFDYDWNVAVKQYNNSKRK